MIELPEPIAYQGRRYSTDADDPGWGTWITLSVDEVDHWKNLIAAGYKREVRELRTTDQLRTYGKACAAEAREQMRGELKTVKKHALNGVDLPCIECGIVGCNGECSGDGAMGD